MTDAATTGTEAGRDDRLFLVTGATGKTGSGTVRLLLERGHRARAMVHHDDERSRALAVAGAEVVVADFLDLDGVTAALRGVSGAYFCYPVRPGLVESTAIFAQAATESGVRSVVNMSQVSARREARSHAARQHWLSERLLGRTGLVTTHLRPTFFAETNDIVAKVGGRAPLSVEQFVARHRRHFDTSGPNFVPAS